MFSRAVIALGSDFGVEELPSELVRRGVVGWVPACVVCLRVDLTLFHDFLRFRLVSETTLQLWVDSGGSLATLLGGIRLDRGLRILTQRLYGTLHWLLMMVRAMELRSDLI